MRILIPVLVAAITACSSPGPLTSQEPAPETTPRTVRVDATATVQRPPDQATVMLAVETMDATARAATDANAAAMERVIAALRDVGIDEDEIRTQRIELHPRYDQRRDGPPTEIVAYQATNQVEVQVDDIDRVGAVVDAAVTAGANRVTGIRFEVSDPTRAYHEALARAMDMARAEAEVLAGALGETLGPALEVSTGGAAPGPFAMAAMARMDAGAESMAPPVSPGQLEIRASVTVVWRLGT